MSKIKTNLVDLSVSLTRFRISPIDKKIRGSVILSSSTRSFCIIPFRGNYLHFISHGCMWSNCVRELTTCNLCDYNLIVL